MLTVKRTYLSVAVLVCFATIAFAQPSNPGFEVGDFTDWTVTGDAWVVTDDAAVVGAGLEGTYFASSWHVAEPNLGTITSSSFTLGPDDDVLTFLYGGHDGWPGDTRPKGVCFVQVKDAADDSIIAGPIAPPNVNGLLATDIDLSAHEGKTVYIEVVDGDDATAYAWIVVDNFGLKLFTAPAGINGNGNFETGDYTAWTTTGTAFGTAPVGTGPSSSSKEGSFYLDSHQGVETNTGTIVSDAFTVTAEDPFLLYLLGGWDGNPANGSKGVSFVQVRNAADDAIIAGPIAPPNGNAMVESGIDLAAYVGTSVYVEVVDGDDGGGYAWLAADNFRMGPPPPPPAAVDHPVTAAFAPVAPVIDGIVTAGEYRMTPLTLSTDNAFAPEWGGSLPSVPADDCSFDLYVAWNAQGVYVAMDVNDNVVKYGWTEGEFLQIVFDIATATGQDTGSLADFELLEEGGTNWRNNAGGGLVDWGEANITSNYTLTAAGYTLEVLFPWDEFNIVLPVIETGAQLKALFGVVDRDAADAALNVFVISSGVEGGNPFGTHEDISLLTLGDSDPASAPDEDWDNDGLTNGEEAALGTNPLRADSDGDGISDINEVGADATYDVGTDTDPNNPDTDGDGHSDGAEASAGTDPLDENSFPDLSDLPVAGVLGLALLASALTGLAIRRRK